MVQISKKDHHFDCIRPPFRKLFICCLMVLGLAEMLPAHSGALVKAGWPGYVFLFLRFVYVQHAPMYLVVLFFLLFTFLSFAMPLC